MIFDILKDRFKVRGEDIHVKDSFRIIAAYSLNSDHSQLRLKDMKKTSFDVAEFKKDPVTFEGILRKYPVLASNTLSVSIVRNLHDIVTRHNKDPKSELKSTIIDMDRFIKRVDSLFVRTFKNENPIHFSINFK